MRIKNKIALFTLLTVLLGGGLICYTKIYAKDHLSSVIQADIFDISKDKSAVYGVLKGRMSETQNFMKETNKLSSSSTLSKDNIASLDPKEYCTSYKIYFIKPDIIDIYNKTQKFSDVIAENYMWETPLLNDNGDIVSSTIVMKGNHNWEFGSTGLEIGTDEIKLSSNPQKIKKLLEDNGINRIKDIKHVRIALSKFDMFYVAGEDDKEYIIPFSENPKFLFGLTNYKKYPASEVMKVFAGEASKYKRRNNLMPCD